MGGISYTDHPSRILKTVKILKDWKNKLYDLQASLYLQYQYFEDHLETILTVGTWILMRVFHL